jgi:zinc transport system substrate-binding protein
MSRDRPDRSPPRAAPGRAPVGALLFTLTACGNAPPPPAAPEPLQVAALSFPAAWLAEQVGGGAVQVRLLPPAGEDPPTWTPTPEQIAGLRDADLIVAAGAGYEAWTAMATLPDDKQLVMAEGIQPIMLAGTRHSHGGKAEHGHEGVDPHVWTDPTQVAAAARRLATRLAVLDPPRSAQFTAGADAVTAAAAALDVELATATQPLQDRPLLANHPSFNYLARRYHLTLDTLDLDPTAAPSPEAREDASAWLAGTDSAQRPRSARGPLLIWEATPTPDARDALPATFTHLVLDPAEQPGADGRYDWIAAMKRTAAALAAAPPRPTPP